MSFSTEPNFLKDKISLNVLANSIQNGADILKEMDQNALIGVLTTDFSTMEEAVIKTKEIQKALDNNISIGLGAGNPRQNKFVQELAGIIQPKHVNQIFSSVNGTRESLGQDKTFVNGLVSPTGKIGLVNIGTGPISSQAKEDIIISVDSALDLLIEMGANSIKYFPMRGLNTLHEFEEVCRVCARRQFNVEPTGGIGLENFEQIVQTAIQAGVPKVIPHVYTSIIDKETHETRIDDIKQLRSLCENILK